LYRDEGSRVKQRWVLRTVLTLSTPVDKPAQERAPKPYAVVIPATETASGKHAQNAKMPRFIKGLSFRCACG
jgi:hypothetical protein